MKIREIYAFRHKKRLAATALAIAAACALICQCSLAAQQGGSEERGEIIHRTLVAVAQNYYDPGRVKPPEMLGGALDEMQLGVPEILVTDRESGKLGVTVGLASKRIAARPMSSLSDLSRALREVLGFALAHYRQDEETRPEEVEYAAAEGLLRTLDPHSGFLTPKVFKEFKVGTKGNFGGLGIVISLKDGMLTVIAPIEGTPASAAGIMAGDRILQIDDESTINMSLTDAVNKLRGDVGSRVTVAVETPGRPVRKITLTRALINIESVKHSVLTRNGKRIGYLRIKNFQSNTNDDVQKALAKMHRNGAKLDGMIIDVRNNPGGLLNVAVDVADNFMREGVIVSTVGARGKVMDVDEASRDGTEPDYPIVVMMNEGSASAAEIVAGALALNDRAVTAGQRTFGKGSVQTVMEVGEGAAVKLTIAQYKPAGRQSIQIRGIAPDIALIPSTVDVDAMNIVEDKRVSEKDLERAIAEEKSEGGPLSEPKYSLYYSAPKRDEKWLEEKSRREYSKEPELADDFEVEFALRLIAEAGDPSAAKTLEKASSVIKAVEEDQQKLLGTSLAALGVNWSKAKADGRPAISVSHRLLKAGKPVSRARAGDKVDLEVSVANSGKGVTSRLIGYTESEIPYLENLEFPFGRVAPGQSRSFSSPIEIPESEPSANRTLELMFNEGNGNAPPPSSIRLQVDELLHPAFAFSMQLPSVSQGRPFPRGSSIPVNFEIYNQGKGTSGDETVVTLSNECGEKLFIERGRSKIGVLPPGGRRRASFSFHMTDGEADEDGCALKLTVADFKHLTILTKKIDLTLESGTTRPAPGKKHGPPTIEVTSAPRSIDSNSATISGIIKDAEPIRDVFVFVKDRKVAYIPNAEESGTMPFSVSVPLEEGSNNVTIGARNVQDITARKLMVIERKAAGSSARGK